MEENRTTLYMDTFNRYNRYQQELTFLNQKYASFFNQRDEKERQLSDVDIESLDKLHKGMVKGGVKLEGEDSSWFKEFQNRLADFGVNVDRQMIRSKGIMEILYPLTDDQIVEMLGFFWIENIDERKKNGEEDLNQVLLEGFLNDIHRYKAIKEEMDKFLNDGNNKAIIARIGKLIKHDLITTLQSEKSLLEDGEEVSFKGSGGKRKFSRHHKKGEENEGGSSVEEFDTRELHDKFTTSILTFHEIEKLYQKYNYVFTLRDIKDLHVILDALRSGEMVLMTGDTGSGKTELSLLIANLYLDEVYKNKEERKDKQPIFVTGNSDTDFSDLTLEKIITSKNALTNQNEAIYGSGDEKPGLKTVFDAILKSDEVQQDMEKRIDTLDYTPEKKERLKEVVKNFDFFKYSIFTEFHMQGIVKAMSNGVPLILDEINGISPEVLLGLNHYFTRRVGQEVSLGNGFDPVTIKEGFCIICTGNDKNENSKVNRYQGRYNIDESLLNRMYRVCKGYHKQDITSKDYENENSTVSTQEQAESQIDYMNENELYGVILMLCFNKKGNDKDINEISNPTVLKKMINTQTVGFDLMKEEFKGKDINEAKRMVFKELRNLAKFVHFVQEAYQGNAPLLSNGAQATLNSSPFSMRQLVSIIRDWKSDTKSLWYHLYNVYVRQIPVANEDRYYVYRIAQETGFITKEEHIEQRPEDIKKMTQMLEEENSEAYHVGAHTRNVHVKQTVVDDDLLDSHLIITKQDVYREYFGHQFGNISDEAFEQQIQEEQKELEKIGEVEAAEDSPEVKKFRIEASLGIIAKFLNDKNNPYFKSLSFEEYYPLPKFCEKDKDGKYGYITYWEEVGKLKEASDILGYIAAMFEGSDTGEVSEENVQEMLKAFEQLGSL